MDTTFIGILAQVSVNWTLTVDLCVRASLRSRTPSLGIAGISEPKVTPPLKCQRRLRVETQDDFILTSENAGSRIKVQGRAEQMSSLAVAHLFLHKMHPPGCTVATSRAYPYPGMQSSDAEHGAEDVACRRW